MTNESKKESRGAGRVAFLARVDDFRELLDAGHPMRSVFDDYAEQLGIGYPQFTKYVSRYIRKEKDDGHQKRGQGKAGPATQTQPSGPPPAPARADGDAGAASPAKQPRKPGDRLPGFTHDPKANDRNDLI